jgi:hypothetical protein
VSLVGSAVSQHRVSEEPVGQAVLQRPARAATSQPSEAAQYGPSLRPELELRKETRSPPREKTEQRDASASRFISGEMLPDARVTLSQPLVPIAPAARLSAPLRLQSPRDGSAPLPALYEQPDTEPAVHVTIGRIEVTALSQPAQVKRAPAARQPSMSLEDYLARRQRREA